MTVDYPNAPIEYLTKAAYAEHVGIVERQIERYLAAGRIPGAIKDGGKWIIPADARPTSSDVVPIHTERRAPLMIEATRSTVQLVDEAPILPTLDEAGELLRITASQVAALRRQGVLVGVKIDGRWRITAASIRALAGI